MCAMAMMETPLNTWLLFGHAPRYFPDTEVVTRLPDGRVHRYTYAAFARRAQQSMHALDALGLAPDDRVATLAWNGYRHLEADRAVPCTGRVLHPEPEALPRGPGVHHRPRGRPRHPGRSRSCYHFWKVHARAASPVLRHVIAPGEVPGTALPGSRRLRTADRRSAGCVRPPRRAHRPTVAARPVLHLRHHRPPQGRALHTPFDRAARHRRAPVRHGHRPRRLRTAGRAHVPRQRRGVPGTATPYGAKQVFLSGSLDLVALVELMAAERVTVAAGVPTIWMAVADEITARGGLPSLRHLLRGGARPPRALIERYRRDFGIPLVQVWGMTETSPLASVAWPKERMRDWEEDRITDAVRTRAGFPPPGVQMDIRDEVGHLLALDGTSMGDLLVRGDWIADSYLGGVGRRPVHGGRLVPYRGHRHRLPGRLCRHRRPCEGSHQVRRRMDLLGGHGVGRHGAAGGRRGRGHRRSRRQVAGASADLRRPAPGFTVTLERVRAHLEAGGSARWQLPDRIEVVEAIPRTGVGKFDKKALRARFDS